MKNSQAPYMDKTCAQRHTSTVYVQVNVTLQYLIKV